MNIYEKLMLMNDVQITQALENQANDPESRYFGGIIDDEVGIPSPSHVGTAGYMASMAAALVSEDSRYYRDDKLLAALDNAAGYMLNRQHPDGTISLGSTNFNSPPDTGFVVTGLSQIYHLLASASWEKLDMIANKVKLFLERSIPALLTGGCHTPNHRWVMTAALGSLHNIFKRDELLRRADEWLAEGLDCTEDGEWTERSNGIYNTVSDIMLYYTAQYCRRPDVLECVRKNLKMMVYMVHYDGEVVTDYSGRQDFGVVHDLSEYFLSYRLMAAHDRDPLFASMFDLTAATMTRLGPVNNHALLGYLVFPCNIDTIERKPLPERYRRAFNEHHPVAEHLKRMEQIGHHGLIRNSSMHTSFGAPLIRYRNEETSVTVMSRAASFFSLRHGDARLLGVSISSMFTPGVVEMESFTATESGCRMKTVMEKGYNGPVPSANLPNNAGRMSPWYLLPHHLRALTHVQKHQIEVEITQYGEGWTIRIKSDDRQDVIMQVLFVFGKECTLTGSGLDIADDGLMIWKSGVLRCSSGEDWIEMIGGQLDHKQMYIRNASVRAGGRSVSVNLLTPFDKVFHIRFSGSKGGDLS